MTVHPNICLVIVGILPSVSAGWRISEESFFEPAVIFSTTKSQSFIWLIRQSSYRLEFPIFKFFLTSESLAYLMNGSIISGLKAPTLASTNITWEKSLHNTISV